MTAPTTTRRRSPAHAAMERALSEAIRDTRRYYLTEAAAHRAGLQSLRKELRANMPTDLDAALDALLEEYAYLGMDLQHVHLHGGEPELEGRLKGLSVVIDELEYAALY